MFSNLKSGNLIKCWEETKLTDLPIDLCGFESGVEIPGTSQLSVDHEIGTTETIKPPEDRNYESEVAVV